MEHIFDYDQDPNMVTEDASQLQHCIGMPGRQYTTSSGRVLKRPLQRMQQREDSDSDYSVSEADDGDASESGCDSEDSLSSGGARWVQHPAAVCC